MKLFFDTEFTGLTKDTSLISIGIVDENGRSFYGVFTDYKKEQIDDWLQENVINNLDLENANMVGTKSEIKDAICNFIKDYDNVEMWSDCLAYDWILLLDLFGGSFGFSDALPNVNYIPFDICTLFWAKGVDADISREEFAEVKGIRHNALHDAKVIKKCFNKLTILYYN